MKRLLLIATLFTAGAGAATYHVRNDGDNSNGGLTDSAAGAWLTIDYAADHVSAGDVVRVHSGSYAERVSPAANGTSTSNTVTFVADGPVQVDGWDLLGNAYIRIVGFIINAALDGTTNQACVSLYGPNVCVEIWHNTMLNGAYNGLRTEVDGSLSRGLLIGNLIYDVGIGNFSGSAMTIRGYDNLVAFNEIREVDPDAFAIFGKRNRFVGNYVHDLIEGGPGHPDVFQSGTSPDGWAFNVFETTFYVARGYQLNEHVSQFSNEQDTHGPDGGMLENLFRRNVWHNVSQGTIGINQTSYGPISRTRIYNNTTAEACEASNARYGIAIYGERTYGTFIFNNIEYESWGNSVSEDLAVYYVEGGLMHDYNLAFDPDNSHVSFDSLYFGGQAHGQRNVDPRFLDYAHDNFRLSTNSGAIDNGGPLTYVTSGNSTGGTTFSVEEAGFFRGDNTALSQYEGSLVVGDTITVGTNVLTIDSISGSNITVTTSFGWKHGDPVCYGDDATPDIGAYPARHVPLTSATISTNESTYTVIPDGDTRWVVFSQDGIPHTVDNAPPYAATIASGVVSARAYPLYASATVSVLAAGEGEGASLSNQPAPPVITSQPVGGRAAPGESFALSAQATGTNTLTYQWFREGIQVAGGTSDSLLLTNLSSIQAGKYWVRITDDGGSVTSSNAYLAVSPQPRMLQTGVISSDGQAHLEILLSANGRENLVEFSLGYLTNELANPVFTSAFPFATTTVDSSEAAAGIVGLRMQLPAEGMFGSGPLLLGHFTFDFVSGTNPFAGGFYFTNAPVDLAAADTNGQNLVLAATVSPSAQSIEGPSLNRLSGLWEQRIWLGNGGPQPMTNAQVLVSSLGNDSLGDAIVLFNAQSHTALDWNADGVTEMLPWVQVQSLGNGEATELMLEYYVFDHVTPPTPGLLTLASNAWAFTAPATPVPPEIMRTLHTNGVFLIEFNTELNRNYYIQYGASLEDLLNPALVKTAVPAITGTGERVQWIDVGPPTTDSPPTDGSRFYRVLTDGP